MSQKYIRNTEGGDTGHKKKADGQDVSTAGGLEYIPKGKIVLHITRDALNAANWTTLPLFVGQGNAEFSSLINFEDLKRAISGPRKGMIECVIPLRKTLIMLQWDI